MNESETLPGKIDSRHVEIFPLAILLIVLAAGVGLYWYFSTTSFDQVTSGEKAEIATIADASRSGEYAQSIAKFKSMVADPNYDKNTKARATVAASHARLRGIDSLTQARQQVNDLKKIVEDTSIDAKIRAEAIYILGAAYDIRGLDRRIFLEVYSTEPYKSKRVMGSYSLSALNMYEWSFSTYYLSKTALSIALMHVRDAFRFRYEESDLSKTVDPENAIALTEEYLHNADLLQSEESKAVGYTPGVSDLGNRYWHTFLIGALAHLKGGDYTKQYRNEYETLIAALEQDGGKDQDMVQYLNFAYWNYAMMLVLIDNDEATAKTQLNKLIANVRNDKFYDVNQFVSVIKRYKTDPRVDLNSRSLTFLGDISPEFKSFIEEIQNRP